MAIQYSQYKITIYKQHKIVGMASRRPATDLFLTYHTTCTRSYRNLTNVIARLIRSDIFVNFMIH